MILNASNRTGLFLQGTPTGTTKGDCDVDSLLGGSGDSSGIWSDAVIDAETGNCSVYERRGD